MARKMPAQRPGRSETVVVTPDEFIVAVKRRFTGKRDFAIDLAATSKNAKADDYYTEDDDALHPDTIWKWDDSDWGWLNPPYDKIGSWVKKAYESKQNVIVLVPASVGSNWWRDYVHEKCYVNFLNGRIQFVGHETGYPKDLALLLYDTISVGYDIWRWRDE